MTDRHKILVTDRTKYLVSDRYKLYGEVIHSGVGNHSSPYDNGQGGFTVALSKQRTPARIWSSSGGRFLNQRCVMQRVNVAPYWIDAPRDRAEWLRLYRSARHNLRASPIDAAFGASSQFDPRMARADRRERERSSAAYARPPAWVPRHKLYQWRALYRDWVVQSGPDGAFWNASWWIDRARTEADLGDRDGFSIDRWRRAL